MNLEELKKRSESVNLQTIFLPVTVAVMSKA
jgi:hypothetical protein